jgi:predicted dehydrogenase
VNTSVANKSKEYNGRAVFNWGIVGTGQVAHDFSEALRETDEARLLAVASRDRDRAKAFAARVGAMYSFDSYSSLLALPELDVVYVATPNHRHKDDCLQAIAARKAVVCEKPLALNAAEAAMIAEAARKANVFCMEGMWTFFIPSVVEAEKLLRQGAIGRPVFLSGSFGVPTVFSEENRFFNQALGGGALLDRGCYPISLALKFLGDVESVSGTCILAKTGVDATAVGLIRFAGGALAVIEASLVAYQSNNLVISGTMGRIVLHESITKPQMLSLAVLKPVDIALRPRAGLVRRLSRHGVLAKLKFLLRERPRYIAYKGNGYIHEIEEVHVCLRAGASESSIVPLDFSVKTLEVIDAIKKDSAALATEK